MGSNGSGPAPGRRVLEPAVLERALRHYAEFWALYEATGTQELASDGVVINVLDLLDWIDELPDQQRAAVTLTCIYNLKEAEAARVMGLGWSQLVGSYKRLALKKLVDRHVSADTTGLGGEAL